jgi:hypothetical protein
MRYAMTRVVLPLAAVLVLGLGVYLFVAVRATPASEPVVVGRAPPPAVRAPMPEPTPSPPATPPVERPPVERPPPPSTSAPSLATPTAPAPTEQADAKLEAVMAEANKAYDRSDFDDAKTIAGRLLAKDPTNVRMLRIMVSASCQDGDAAVAQAHYARLPAADQAQMRTRCARFGVTFVDKP